MGGKEKRSRTTMNLIIFIEFHGFVACNILILKNKHFVCRSRTIMNLIIFIEFYGFVACNILILKNKHFVITQCSIDTKRSCK